MSHTNIRSINSTEINNSGPFRVGSRLTSGTAGQVLKSRGRDLSPEWDTDTDTTYQGSATIDIDTTTDPDTINCIKVPHALTFTGYDTGTFDGSSNLTINLVDTDTTYTAGDGIVIGGTTIEANIDEDTIDFNGGVMEVMKVPNTLTFTGYDTGTFDGSSNLTINLVDTDTTYTAGNGIQISGSNIIQTKTDNQTIRDSGGGSGNNLEVIKVPNSLTFTGYDTGTFDGSNPLTINLVDNDNQLNLTGALPMVINNGGGYNREVELQFDNITLGSGGGSLEVLKVPNTLTFTGYASGTFDGSNPLTINLVDTDTTYQGGTGISIDTTTNPDTINCKNIPNTALLNSTISGVSLGGNLASITFYQADGTFITSYNGANPPTSVILDGDTTYQGGSNISIDTTTTPDTINLDTSLTNIQDINFLSAPITTTLKGNDYPLNPTTATYLDLSSSTNVFPKFVGGSEILKSMSYIENTTQNWNRIYNTANEYLFSGSQDYGSDTLEIDFIATSTTGYCEFGFYANSGTSGMIFFIGIAAATGGTSPFSTSLGSGAVSIDAYKLGLFDGSTSYYSLRELLDFTGLENTYITSKFFFNNLTIGTRYRMALYGRCYDTGSIFIHSGGRSTTGLPSGPRAYNQPAFMKFYEYDNSIGGARTTGSGGGGSI